MAEDSQRAERQRALEEKRNKLDRLKREREERNQQQAANAQASAAAAEKEKNEKENSRAQVDDLVNSLLQTSVSDASAKNDDDNYSSSNNNITSPASSDRGSAGNSSRTHQRAVELTVKMGVSRIDIPPRVPEVYEKGSQTDVFEFDYGGADAGRFFPVNPSIYLSIFV